MPDFTQMTLTQLVSADGFDCACGRHHVCSIDFLKIGPDALDALEEMLHTLQSTKPFIVCDENTYKAAGSRVCDILDRSKTAYTLYMIPSRGGRIAPAEWEVGSVIMHYDPTCDLVLGVGSGVVNDICKVVGHAVGKKNAIVGTAPSMDGYASDSSSMEVNQVKVSIYDQAPSGILLDTEIMRMAPIRMLWAGLGDMVAKYIAICEWRISHIVSGEYYCEDIARLMREAVRRVVSAADGLSRREEESVRAVAEGLVLGGICMAYAKISRPASGLEHYFSHMWEMMALERGLPYDLHGIQVGVGTVLTLGLYQDIVKIKPDRQRALSWWQDMTREKWLRQIRRIFGKTADEIIRLEDREHKNDQAEHEARLDRIIDHWDEILSIISEELPQADRLCEILRGTGMPMTPGEIGISAEDTVNAFIGARDVRKKYMTCTLLWDLGLTDEFARRLAGTL